MRRASFFLLAVLLLCYMTVEAAKPVKKADLRILYVGGTSEYHILDEIPPDIFKESVASRMKAFESFLNDYFTSVTVIHADEYVQAMSDDYDVTVMDGLPKPIVPRYEDAEKGIYLPAGYLTEDFDRPMLTIAHISDRIGRSIGSKNDCCCLCLFSDAVKWRAEHPIFHGPFDVKMTVVDKPTPEAFQYYPKAFEGEVVPETMPMWRVQAEDYEEGDRMKRIGMVSRPDGYEDSPDAEFISGGVCYKGANAVAIGRHGNFFHWGFAASPDYMTEEAKTVLANAIVYISKFAGQTPIARKYDDRIATRWRGLDGKAPVSNPYSYRDEGEDEDVKSLGIPNDDKRLLDAAIRLLEKGQDTDKARRILTRYTLNDFETAKEWRDWYEKYKDKLFFTEAGGWLFLVNSREPGVNDYTSFLERQTAKQLPAGETNDRNPVAVTAGVTVMPDGSRVLTIKAVIHPGYHIYDKVAKGDPFIATKVEITLPDGYTAVGELERPEGSYYTSNGTTEYKNTVVFSQKFTGSGSGEAKCKVTYQCCDPNICFPPKTEECSVTL